MFLRHFLRVWLQSLKKVLKWPIKNFSLKKLKKVSKTQNFTLISNPLKNVLKNLLKKLLAKMWRKHALFPLLLMFVKLALLITFLCAFFKNFFNGFEISMKFCVHQRVCLKDLKRYRCEHVWEETHAFWCRLQWLPPPSPHCHSWYWRSRFLTSGPQVKPAYPI